MPRGKGLDRTILEAALEGLNRRLSDLDGKIGNVRKLLRGGGRGRRPQPSPAATNETAPRKRRVMSAAARKRIAEAQKRRWAQFRAKGGKGEAGAE